MKQNINLKSKNIERAIKDHLTETAATSTDTSPQNVVTDVMQGAIPYLTREIATFYPVGKGDLNVIVPILGKGVASTLTTGDYGATGAGIITFKTITTDHDAGINLQWNRDFAERAAWDVMSPFLKEGARAVEDTIMTDMIGTITAIQANGNTFAIAGTLTWANITTGFMKLAEDDFHCDKVIMSPTLYGELLQLQQFVDASYMGSDSNIRTGVIKTQLGADFICTSKMPSTIVFFIDSTKLLGVGMKRDALVEEYEYPDTNKYGLVVSTAYGIQSLNTLAVSKGGR